MPQPRRVLLPGDGPLAKVPPAAVFVLVAAVFGLGVWLGGPLGAALLGLLALGVATLLAVTWRLMRPADRALRVGVLLVLVLVALSVLR